MRILVASNVEKDIDGEFGKKIKQYLTEKDVAVSLCRISYNSLDSLKDILRNGFNPDCIMVLGGDGTFIQVAGIIAGESIPMLGINLGNLGYLAETEKDQIYPTIDRLIKGEYDIEERMMLRACAKDCTDAIALNDIVISRKGGLRVIRCLIYVNGKFLSAYDADGVIVSTPTGSTGYNLSAGGPIIEPDAKMIVVTPICPHTISTRAVVLSPDDEIEIQIAEGRYDNQYEASVISDGVLTANLASLDTVKIQCAKEVTKVIKMSKESFLDTLARKMGHN